MIDRTAYVFQLVFIIAGWVFYAFLVGLALMIAFGVIVPDPGGNPWWLIPLKGGVWPVAGHAMANLIGRVRNRLARGAQPQ